MAGLFRAHARSRGFGRPAAVLALGGPTLAGSETWLVTEEDLAGVKGSQGNWIVKIEGNQLSGVAAMQANNGSGLTYKLEGVIADGVYTVTMKDRSDGKKSCVWNASAAGPETASSAALPSVGQASFGYSTDSSSNWSRA
jgi:hypothetical protein